MEITKNPRTKIFWLFVVASSLSRKTRRWKLIVNKSWLRGRSAREGERIFYLYMIEWNGREMMINFHHQKRSSSNCGDRISSNNWKLAASIHRAAVFAAPPPFLPHDIKRRGFGFVTSHGKDKKLWQCARSRARTSSSFVHTMVNWKIDGEKRRRNDVVERIQFPISSSISSTSNSWSNSNTDTGRPAVASFVS